MMESGPNVHVLLSFAQLRQMQNIDIYLFNCRNTEGKRKTRLDKNQPRAINY